MKKLLGYLCVLGLGAGLVAGCSESKTDRVSGSDRPTYPSASPAIPRDPTTLPPPPITTPPSDSAAPSATPAPPSTGDSSK